MGLLDRLGFVSVPKTERDASVLAAIEERLEQLGDRAGWVAALAALLCRVAYADDEVSEVELRRITEIVTEHASLSPAEAEAVTALARERTIALSGGGRQDATRRFAELSSAEEKRRLVDCLYAVAVADDIATLVEEREIHSIASALLVSRKTVFEVRSQYREQLEELQKLRAFRETSKGS